MKILRVGDPHVKPNNLEESDDLIEFVLSMALKYEVDRVELLGDLHDTHDIVRLRVQKFWHKWFDIFSRQDFSTIVLVGNHDLTGTYDDPYSSLNVFKYFPYCFSHEGKSSGVKIVDESYLEGIYGYLPYIHDNEKFIKEANNLADQGAKVLVSHPNFEGAVYDNGTPLQSGVDHNRLSPNFLHLIGGHIHTELELGRIWYAGNPRWLTKSCANKKKGIWVVTHDDVTGQILSKEFLSTEHVCTPIVSLAWHEGTEKPEIPKNAKVDIELVGSSDWVTKTKKELVGSVSVSSKITDIKKSRERKSGKSLYEFVSKHYQTDKREKLIDYMKGLELLG